MYRRNEEQMEMLKVSEKMIDEIFDAYNKKELDNMNFISKCSFVCGFVYATFGDSERYELLEASIKFLIGTYQYDGGDKHETQ